MYTGHVVIPTPGLHHVNQGLPATLPLHWVRPNSNPWMFIFGIFEHKSGFPRGPYFLEKSLFLIMGPLVLEKSLVSIFLQKGPGKVIIFLSKAG